MWGAAARARREGAEAGGDNRGLNHWGLPQCAPRHVAPARRLCPPCARVRRFCCPPFLCVPVAMPGKGHAFDKPGVNFLHKAGSAKAAQVKAAASMSNWANDEWSQSLVQRVESSSMSDSRKAHALKVIGEAVEKLRTGIDPLSGLNPPPGCNVCAGNVKGTHHFMCRKRSLEPSGAERGVRTFCMNKLAAAWREKLYAEASEASVRLR